jgi:hypothetical protein
MFNDEVIREMIEALRAAGRFGPYVMYVHDSALLSAGHDPSDYPELEGFPGIRVVRLVPQDETQ